VWRERKRERERQIAWTANCAVRLLLVLRKQREEGKTKRSLKELLRRRLVKKVIDGSDWSSMNKTRAVRS
jgi:hypothetical protein